LGVSPQETVQTKEKDRRGANEAKQSILTRTTDRRSFDLPFPGNPRCPGSVRSNLLRLRLLASTGQRMLRILITCRVGHSSTSSKWIRSTGLLRCRTKYHITLKCLSCNGILVGQRLTTPTTGVDYLSKAAPFTSATRYLRTRSYSGQT
jgi:hypothetical protein